MANIKVFALGGLGENDDRPVTNHRGSVSGIEPFDCAAGNDERYGGMA